ncbi:hypothetical protein Corgl_1293 [Coriobacterium glomerans PW2]|uniref:Transmembrane protein n=1 Tax=Coriobacterium glomerans (strain ATCC 49209 / DSM 20642 / JCM 10262 / PW2) TaxID=700015 RepID=F2N8L1_CORGP|nr:hypothetical protein [Coriobacterium glomerans]AEB07394.1 hypothetical protein Corgl_1293 [Coriobacterium glomerans PW2]
MEFEECTGGSDASSWVRQRFAPDAASDERCHSKQAKGRCGLESHTSPRAARQALASWLRAHLAPECQVRLVALALAASLALALAAMLVISRYDHSYADDWHYGVDVHLSLDAGRGVWGALSAALGKTVETFDSWQGTYSAIMLMCLQPGVVSEDLYGWGAVLVIVALVVCTGYAASVLLRDVLGASRPCWIAFTSVALLLQTQLLPSPVEGFWWYNSAIYYTFYHALMLLMVGMAIRLLRGGNPRSALSPRAAVARWIALTLLAVVVAGGNFVTALIVELALCGAAVWSICRATPRRALILITVLAFTIGFSISVFAPGNALRQASQFPRDGMGVPSTLLKSALAGFEYAVMWTNGLLVVSLAALAPIMVRVARGSRLSFRLPGAAWGASLIVFMASFAPTFFSMGDVGPGRVQNIRYDLFVLLVIVCTTWTVGRCVRYREHRRGMVCGSLFAPGLFESARVFAAWYGVVALLAASSLVGMALDSRHVGDLTSLSAAEALWSGRARAYDRQVRARLAAIGSSESETLEVAFYTVRPKVLFMGDIRDNMDNYINYRLSEWFGKSSIIGVRAPSG